MPDWERLLKRKLGRLRPRARQEDRMREMAGYLEDRFEERLALGESPRAAARAVIAGAGPFLHLARELERLEDPMPRRLKALWIPALAVSVLVMALLYAVSRAELGVQVFWHPPRAPFFLHWPWLLALPFVGAAAAAWSRREGGTRAERLLVAASPPLALLPPMLPIALLRVAITGRPGEPSYTDVLLVLLNWVVLPATALLLGALPLLREDRTPRPA